MRLASLMLVIACPLAAGCEDASSRLAKPTPQADNEPIRATPEEAGQERAADASEPSAENLVPPVVSRTVTGAAEPAGEEGPARKRAVAQEQATIDDYKPPYPERAELFQPPQFTGTVRRERNDNASESVVLLGFANLDTPRAVLQINGAIAPLASGEEREGVRVVTISPPQAVLQRGRTRWTASID